MRKIHYFQLCSVCILWAIWIVCGVKDIYLSLFLLCFVFLFVLIFSVLQKNIRIVWLVIISLSLAWIYGIYHLHKVDHKKEIVDQYMWSYIYQEGIVQEVYSRKEFYDEYKLKVLQIGDQKIDESLYYLFRIPKNFALTPNQHISYMGKLYPLENFDGFAYEDFMLSRGIYYSTSGQTFETLFRRETGIKYTLWIWRENLLSRIERIFPQSEAIFLWGILFGARENIPADLKEDFNNSWLTHFIAVSGFNITLCIIFITVSFGFFPMYIRIFFAVSCIGFFCVFVWLGAPVVRAGIMWLIGYIFLQHGNSVNNMSLILLTAVLMTLYSPFSLLYDVSMHLSFLAVIGIIYTQDFFTKIFSWVPSVFAIREALVLTLAALSFALPIMIFQFGQVSLFAPFANIAVTWSIPLAMLLGSITLIWDMFSSQLGNILWYITWMLLSYDIAMVRFFWNLEFALLRFDFGLYKNYLQALYFIILSYLVIYYRQRNKKQPI